MMVVSARFAMLAVVAGVALLSLSGSDVAHGSPLQHRSFLKYSARLAASDGESIHYTDTGAPEGRPDAPALIVLHGVTEFGTLLYDSVGFNEELKSLARVIVVDWRGHGLSSQVEPHSVHLPRIAQDVKELVDSLELNKFMLYGMSTGWSIAMQFVKANPEFLTNGRLVGLIDEDMAPTCLPQEGWTGFGEPRDALGGLYTGLRDYGLGPVLENAFKPVMCSDGEMAGGERYDACGDVSISAANNVDWHTVLHVMMENFFELDARDTIKQVGDAGIPALVLSGKFSMFTEADMRKQAELLNADFVSLPTGHIIHAVRPEELLETVGAWISDKIAGSGKAEL